MEKQILWQQKKIHYHKIGSGDSLMLVHGFGEEGRVWNQQANFLVNNYCVIIPDLPGTAQSEIINDMSMEGMADVLHEILVSEKIAACTMIGHSMGGYILLAFAEKYPGMLKGFGLFHSSAFADNAEKKEIRRKGITFIREHGAYEFLKTATPNLFSPVTQEKKPELIDKQVAVGHNFLPKALVSYYEAMMARPDRTEVLRKAAFPVLFVMGKYDKAVPPEDTLKQCHLPEISYIHTLEESGHMGMLEETEKSNRILESYLSEI